MAESAVRRNLRGLRARDAPGRTAAPRFDARQDSGETTGDHGAFVTVAEAIAQGEAWGGHNGPRARTAHLRRSEIRLRLGGRSQTRRRGRPHHATTSGR
ncbi:hypothetical protein BURKHO8Y_160034 [Burkholderia sp. 8Y]|nr:hypothetical protein BURKHO8Y_160034 [Burkholderia sp. 8Y]